MMHSGRQSGGPKVSWLMHGFARNVRPAEARSKTSLMCPLATSQHLGENQTDYPSLCCAVSWVASGVPLHREWV